MDVYIFFVRLPFGSHLCCFIILDIMSNEHRAGISLRQLCGFALDVFPEVGIAGLRGSSTFSFEEPPYRFQ